MKTFENHIIENHETTDFLLNGDPVCTLSGNEFSKNEGTSLLQKVIENTTTERLYVHEAFLIKKLLDDVADSNTVLGADMPVTQHQGEIAKILQKIIQQQ